MAKLSMKRSLKRRPSSSAGWAVVLVALLLPLAASEAHAQSAKDRELLLKAAFLYNFAKFVEWPPTAYGSPTAPLTICVHSREALGVIAEAMDGKTVGNRQINVVDARSSNQTVICQLTFIGADEPEPGFAPHLKAPHALTVSDRDRFARTGGMVGLVTVDNKIRFEVNLKTARAAGLRIQAALLRLATDVIE